MYFTDDSLLPENQAPLMITAAPYGPMWMPEDLTPEQKLPVTWEQGNKNPNRRGLLQRGCHAPPAIHVRDPKTGHISKKLSEYGEHQIAVSVCARPLPKRILQVLAGPSPLQPEPEEEAKLQSYDSRHKLAVRSIRNPIRSHDSVWHWLL